VAKKRDPTTLSQHLDQTERELLTVVLDRGASRINRTVHEQFTTILTQELRPRDPRIPQQTLTRSKRWHPRVVPALRQPAPPESRNENPNAIGTTIDRAPYRFRANHLSLPVMVVESGRALTFCTKQHNGLRQTSKLGGQRMSKKYSTPTLVVNIEREYFDEILAIPRTKHVEYRSMSDYWLGRLDKVGPAPFNLRMLNGMHPPVPEATVRVTKVVRNRRTGDLELHLGRVLEVKHWDRRKRRPAR
jgi:hypothetical protein